MIALAADCLVFRMASGESEPFSADMVSIEVMGEASKWFNRDFVDEVTKAVFHYFKHEQKRQSVSVGEFTETLERVLSGLNMAVGQPSAVDTTQGVAEFDLAYLAREACVGWELVFFPRLRQEVRQHVGKCARELRFKGLRNCVKQLLGAQRWGGRCRRLEEQVLSYIRACLSAERPAATCSLVVR